MSLQTIDNRLKDTEVSQHRRFLIKQLHNMEIYYTSDGRKLEDVSLYTLEWTYIDMRNEVARAYGEVVQ